MSTECDMSDCHEPATTTRMVWGCLRHVCDLHAGEEMQEPAAFAKGDLVFASGEYLPRCWLDPAYKSRLHAASG